MLLPEKINIIEVGPRDGFQNIDTFIETNKKIEIIISLIDAGAKKIEVTSFVSPKWIPQLKDATEVIAEIKDYCSDVELIALAPNSKGVNDSISAGVDLINYVLSISEAHNKANVNRTVDESFSNFVNLVNKYPKQKFRLSIATIFGCPFGDYIDINKVCTMIETVRKIGVDEVLLADTIGVANPVQVENILSTIKNLLGTQNITLHFHDTRGMGLANSLTAMQLGFTDFETSIGGLGGCPYAPGAAGNIATEDMVNMLDSMGIMSTYKINKLAQSLKLINKNVNKTISSHMSAILLSKSNDICTIL
jgi:hydroxymethylglutaryl-CoA lyase